MALAPLTVRLPVTVVMPASKAVPITFTFGTLPFKVLAAPLMVKLPVVPVIPPIASTLPETVNVKALKFSAAPASVTTLVTDAFAVRVG